MMMGMGVFDMPESWYLEYYSENELKTVIKAYVIDKEIDVYIDAEIDEKIDEQLDEWFRNNKIFTEVTGTYSVNGNELTLTIPISAIGDNVTQTLTKK
jgi:vacuolar-type H+-ATPase subunit F/Vma7